MATMLLKGAVLCMLCLVTRAVVVDESTCELEGEFQGAVQDVEVIAAISVNHCSDAADSTQVCFQFTAFGRHFRAAGGRVDHGGGALTNRVRRHLSTLVADTHAHRWYSGSLDSAEPSTVKFVAHQGHVSMATVGVNGTIYMLEELEDGRMEVTRSVLGIELYHPHQRKRRADRDRCAVFLDADRHFFDQWGGVGSEDERVANTIIRMMDFIFSVDTLFGIQPNLRDEIGLDIAGAKVHLDRAFRPNAGSEALLNYENFLVGGSQTNQVTNAARGPGVPTAQDVCLNHLFTHVDLNGVLGVAVQASPSTNVLGGICDTRISNENFRHVVNAGLSTTVGANGRTVKYWQTVLTAAHEFGHNFGAAHDCELSGSNACNALQGSQCVPTSSNGGAYLMFPLVSGNHQNAQLFSPCSASRIRQTVANRGFCLTPEPACGGLSGIACNPVPNGCELQDVDVGPCSQPCGGGVQPVIHRCVCNGVEQAPSVCGADSETESRLCAPRACEGTDPLPANILAFATGFSTDELVDAVRLESRVPVELIAAQQVTANGQDAVRLQLKACRVFSSISNPGCLNPGILENSIDVSSTRITNAVGGIVRSQTAGDDVKLKNSGLAPLLIAGIVVSVVCFVFLICYFAYRKYRDRKIEEDIEAARQTMAQQRAAIKQEKKRQRDLRRARRKEKEQVKLAIARSREEAARKKSKEAILRKQTELQLRESELLAKSEAERAKIKEGRRRVMQERAALAAQAEADAVEVAKAKAAVNAEKKAIERQKRAAERERRKLAAERLEREQRELEHRRLKEERRRAEEERQRRERERAERAARAHVIVETDLDREYDNVIAPPAYSYLPDLPSAERPPPSPTTRSAASLPVALPVARTTRREQPPSSTQSRPRSNIRMDYTIRATKSYQAAESGELSFDAGQFITVLDMTGQHCWVGSRNGVTGKFPTSHVDLTPVSVSGDV